MSAAPIYSAEKFSCGRGLTMYDKKNSGWVEVICGSMFSGKSEELIRRIRWAQLAKQEVIVFKPKIDNRYSEDEIVSHNGTKFTANAVENSAAIKTFNKNEATVIAIDEAQFFDEGIVKVVTELADEGYRIIVAGLDQDFKGEPFTPMPDIMAIAEQITKLQAVCTSCGAAASRTQRLINGEPAHYNDAVVLIGASEKYEARCREHHEVPKKIFT